MEILLASQNTHKQRELGQILTPHSVLLPDQIGIEFEYDETGDTFLSNAKGKADHLFRLTGRPAIADDSGLVVPALDGEPGVYSARYGARPETRMSDADRNEYLLTRMQSIEDRKAYFVCCMVLVLSTERFFIAQETMEGCILNQQVGAEGFGYDPVFYVPEFGCSVAQLPSEQKNKISHRARAARHIRSIIVDLGPEASAS